jgi:serine/threonine protein phosphatase PrpC
MAIGAGTAGIAAAVCDGVASTTHSELAARAAAAAAVATLERVLQASGPLSADALNDVMHEAFTSAQVAASKVGESDRSAITPSTTMVAAIVVPGIVVVGSVGDSRAYWFSNSKIEGRLLTTDDSVMQERMTEGVQREIAEADPDAHAITRWLGVDAGPWEPSTSIVDVREPGWLILCSDGLWNYFDAPSEIACRFDGQVDDALVIAQRLVDAALGAGGSDNVTVAAMFGEPATAAPTATTGKNRTAEQDQSTLTG